ncbi:MAG: imidazoleglycerol-phosphate dehydratase [Thermoproteales archaeon]|nr:imidazoleglycerol-phosphate dehydratase [Thermoproteales archaeon]
MEDKKLVRKTSETEIEITFNLYGSGKSRIETEYKFFNHMIEELAFYALFDLEIKAKGDLAHHVIEDTAIVLGRLLRSYLSEIRYPLVRFGYSITPADDALIIVSIDLSGRSFFNSNLSIKRTMIEDTASEDLLHFLRTFSENGRFNLHILQLAGKDDHHIFEATFKGLGQAFRIAKNRDNGRESVTSTKGSL